ncbi:hypothetical protein DXG03_005527 [Asterophora parasitica]|uniref:Protein CPL1-like domain-containing protein n=1 Tax=Asterophora parasitica TaxID=117018 RepID=A0A9P7KDU8_9AGAR|nr:hypothetical protein DXG03_005527 [Asterophora parasitica]
MRLAPTFIVSSLSLAGLLAPAAAGAIHQYRGIGTHVQGRSSLTAAATLAKRQYKAPREIIDVCVAVSGDVFGSIVGTLLPPSALNLEVCLCLNDLNLWVEASVAGRVLNLLLGRVRLLAALNTLLSEAGEECKFPSKAHRVCVQDEPCAFECEDGYSNVDGECVCQEPYSECNGICGDFDTCGSALPQRRRSVQKITSLAQAKNTCKSKESVCGIAGREGTLDFECVDTSATLDSCGGCIVPHPFYEPHRSTALGIECGRLPGVLTATCSNSSCVVAKCRNGQQPSADGTHCVVPAVPQEALSALGGGGPLRLDFEKRSTVADAVIPNADFRSKLSVVADAIIAVNEVCHGIRHPQTTPVVDYPALVQGAVGATVELLNSHTVLQVVAKVDALAASNAEFRRKINECGCTRWLSLGDLVAQLDAFSHIVLELQTWLKTNPVTTLPGTNPVPVPNTSDLVVDLNLDAILGRIAKSGAGVKVNLDIAAPIIGKVTGLAQLVLKLGKAGANLPVGSTPIVIPIVGSPVVPVDTALVDAVVQAAINLSNSTTVPALVANLRTFLDVNALVSTTLNNCGCVERLGLGALTLALDAVGKAALELKAALKLATNLTGAIDFKLGAVANDLRALLHHTANISVLQGKINAIVKLVLGLGKQAQALPVVGIINNRLLDGVVKATVSLLGSTSVPRLLANLEVLLKANLAIDALLNKCGCVQMLNLGGLQGVVRAVITALIEVKTWCTENVITSTAGPFIPNATALANQLRASVLSAGF